MDEKRYVNLEEGFIVLAIPSTTVEVYISAKVWHNGEVITVGRTMPFEEVRAAFQEAEQGYIPSDTVFSLSEDYTRNELEMMLKNLCDKGEPK